MDSKNIYFLLSNDSIGDLKTDDILDLNEDEITSFEKIKKSIYDYKYYILGGMLLIGCIVVYMYTKPGDLPPIDNNNSIHTDIIVDSNMVIQLVDYNNIPKLEPITIRFEKFIKNNTEYTVDLLYKGFQFLLDVKDLTNFPVEEIDSIIELTDDELKDFAEMFKNSDLK